MDTSPDKVRGSSKLKEERKAESSQMPMCLVCTSFLMHVIMQTLQLQLKDLCLTNVRSWMLHFRRDIIQIRREICALL